MNAQQLKNAILQEAIEGRLVPQDPNDEPASILLERIRKEKERLVKEGKLKKKDLEVKPISEDEIPFEIPESWEWCRVDDIIYPPKYGTSNKSLSIGAIPVLRMGNIQDGEIVFDKLVYSNDITDNEKYNLINGDLLFNRTNSAELVGKTGIYRGQRPAIYAGYLILLRPIGLYPDYLNFVLGSSYARSYCKEVKTIGVQQCNINAEKISSFIIPIPPLTEQQRIVAKIEELLPKVEEYGKAQDALNKLNTELPERLKKSILQEAIEGRLVPQDPNDEPASVLLDKIRKEKEQLVKEGKLKKKDLIETPVGDDETPFNIPKSWKWIRFGDLVSTSTGKTPARGDVRYWGNNDYPWVSISDMKQGETIINTKEYVSAKAANDCFHNEISKCGTLIMSFKLTVGRTAVLGIDAYHNEAIISIRPYADGDNYTRDYLSYILPVVTTWGDSKDAIKGKTLNAKSIYNLLIPLPPLAEQHRIVEKLEQLFGEIDKLKK
jgi:type I restriction enzyme S subunit